MTDEIVVMQPKEAELRQAPHQRLAVHPVRHREPILHNRPTGHGVDFNRILER